MNQKHRQNRPFPLAGFVLIVLGCIFLLNSLHIINFGNVIAHWWPVILILIGFAKLKEQDKTGGALLFLLGIVFLSATLDIINWGSIFRFWPVILIIIGISIVLKGKDRGTWRATGKWETEEDFINGNVIFGALDRFVKSQNFKGGELMALFGGIELDLRGSKMSDQGCDMHLTALFGGIEVIVPADWKVIITGTPVLGGIENKTTWTDSENDENKIYVRCTVAFGGIEIKN